MTIARRRLLAGLAAVPALASIAAHAQTRKVTVLLDWFLNPDHAALVIAKTNGLFEREGLDVELIVPADPNAPPRLVAAGKGDFAISYQPQLQMLVGEGIPLTRVGVVVAQPLNSLVALEGGPIAKIADLKGRKVGYSIAGFEEAILGAMLESVGLTLRDVTLINVNFALTTALKSKQVDAVIGAFRNFELNDLEIEKMRGIAFMVEAHGVPMYDELVIVGRHGAVDTAVAGKLLSAMREATAWIRANDAEAWNRFAAYGGKEVANELNRRAWRDTIPLLASDPAALDRDRYARFATFLKGRGLLKAEMPLDSYLTPVK